METPPDEVPPDEPGEEDDIVTGIDLEPNLDSVLVEDEPVIDQADGKDDEGDVGGVGPQAADPSHDNDFGTAPDEED
jgi:hypothetical protein